MIRLYERKQIDDELWNNCVQKALHSSVTGYTWYLDCLCDNWSALILENYQAVLALPIKSKFKIDYLLQPLFIRSLFIYSEKNISAELLNAFLDKVPVNIKLVDINIESDILITRTNFTILSKPYQLLDIDQSYATIQSHYKEAVNRNLKKANNNNLSIITTISVKQVVSMFKSNVGHKLKDLKAKDYDRLELLMHTALKYDKGFIRGVVDKEKELIAVAFFMVSEKYISFFNGSSTPKGKAQGAMYYLFDEVFKNYATHKEVVDFEGSSIKGIADFNKKFGAKDFLYLQIKRNGLPAIINKLRGK